MAHVNKEDITKEILDDYIKHVAGTRAQRPGPRSTRTPTAATMANMINLNPNSDSLKPFVARIHAERVRKAEAAISAYTARKQAAISAFTQASLLKKEAERARDLKFSHFRAQAEAIIAERAQAKKAAEARKADSQAAKLAREQRRAEKARKNDEVAQAATAMRAPTIYHEIPPAGEVYKGWSDDKFVMTFPASMKLEEILRHIKEALGDEAVYKKGKNKGQLNGEYSALASRVDEKVEAPADFDVSRLTDKFISQVVGISNNRRYENTFDAYEFTIWHEVKGESAPFEARDSITGNCVVDAIQRHFGEYMCEDIAEALYKVYKKHDLNNKPVTGPILRELGQATKLRLIAVSTGGYDWEDTEIGRNKPSRRQKVHIFAEKRHAELHIPLEHNMERWSADYGNPTELTKGLHQQMKYFVKLDYHGSALLCEPNAIVAGSTIYKSFQPSKVTGNVADDTRHEFFDCMDIEQFNYRKWKLDNKIRPLAGVYFDIFRNADHYLSSQRFSDDNVLRSYDMNRAFPSFKTNPLYSKYKLILGYVTLYDAREANQADILDKAGVSFVSSITWINKFVEKTGWIRAGQWHNNISLFTLVSEGWATIEITQTCICRKPEDIEFPFGDSKLVNNAFIGRLIAGASSGIIKQYYKAYPHDINQLMYDLKQDPKCKSCFTVPSPILGHDDYQFVVAETEVAENRSQLYHIHGCILAYQQVTFMKAMVLASSIREDNIVAYNTDGFHVRQRIPLELSDQPGGFKYEKKRIRYHATYDAMEARPFDNDWKINQLQAYEDELPVVLISGPAGCGKSYKRIEITPGLESVVLCPTNALVADTKRRDTLAKTGTPVTTYQKFFGIWINKEGKRGYHKQVFKENLIFDEITIAPCAELQEVIMKCHLHRICLEMIGDVRQRPDGVWITDQMAPVKNDVSLDACLKGVEFTPKEVISDKRRQNAEDSAWIDALRGKSESEIRSALIKKCGLSRWEDVCTKDIIGIANRHVICRDFGNSMIKKFRLERVLARRMDTKKDKERQIVEPKGAISWQPEGKVWTQRKSYKESTPSPYKYEMAFFRTANAMQGQAIDQKYIINLAEADARFLYVAISRCRRLSDIIVIDSKDPTSIFAPRSYNPYFINSNEPAPEPTVSFAEFAKVAYGGTFHHPRTPAYSDMAEIAKQVKTLSDIEKHTYIVTRDDPLSLAVGPQFRLWNDIDDLMANYPEDMLHCIQEVVEPHRPRKLSVNMSWYKYDQDVDAMKWEIEQLLGADLGTTGVTVEVATASGWAYKNSGEVRWMRSARLVVTSHYVDDLSAAAKFQELLSNRVPPRLRAHCNNDESSCRGHIMLFSTREGRQMGSPSDYSEQDIDLARDEFCLTNIFSEHSGELRYTAAQLSHPLLL